MPLKSADKQRQDAGINEKAKTADDGKARYHDLHSFALFATPVQFERAYRRNAEICDAFHFPAAAGHAVENCTAGKVQERQ